MKLKSKHIAFLLLSLFLTIVVERVIPHTHIEENGVVVPDFGNHHNNKQHHSDDEGDSIHSQFYQIFNSGLDFSILAFTIKHQPTCLNSIQLPIVVSNYNILPKILNSILFIVHTSSSKAPPFFIDLIL